MAYSHQATVNAARSVDPDHAREIVFSGLHTKYLWWSIASFIALISLLQLTSYLHNTIAGRRRNSSGRAQDPELAGSARRHHFSLSRLPVAIVNTYRIVAFRYTIGIGSYTLNLAEVFLTVAYIVMLFALAFSNSAFFMLWLLTIGPDADADNRSKATSLTGEKLNIGYWVSAIFTSFIKI